MDDQTVNSAVCRDCEAAIEGRRLELQGNGPYLCAPCEKAAWARIDARAATYGPSTPANNVWD